MSDIMTAQDRQLEHKTRLAHLRGGHVVRITLKRSYKIGDQAYLEKTPTGNGKLVDAYYAGFKGALGTVTGHGHRGEIYFTPEGYKGDLKVNELHLTRQSALK